MIFFTIIDYFKALSKFDRVCLPLTLKHRSAKLAVKDSCLLDSLYSNIYRYQGVN